LTRVFQLLDNQWNLSSGGDEADALLYRSNLLGSNKAITNFGGGNTSAKLVATDPLGREQVEVLWVKGSGGDLGSMDMSGFATLYLDKLLGLESLYQGPSKEDDIGQLIPHCIFNQNPRAPSIDTNLHAYLPFRHIDHMHPDAIIAIATAENGQALCRQIYAGRIGWLDWQRPGFELAIRLRDLLEANPGMEGVILQHHGLFTWGESSEACHSNTIKTINAGIEAVNGALAANHPVANQSATGSPAARQAELRFKVTAAIRNAVSDGSSDSGSDYVSIRTNRVICFNDSERVLDFVNSNDCERLSALGTSCPDHFLRTKRNPLVVSVDDCLAGEPLRLKLAEYRADYRRYYAACRHSDSPDMRDPSPVIVLIPGLGMIGLGSSRTGARIATEFFENAINVMTGAEAFSRYTSLPAQEAFDIEYWLLEEAKLRRLPPPRPLSGQVALVTGAAGGIGSAVSRKLLEQGASLICCDNNRARLEAIGDDLHASFDPDSISCIEMDVTSEDDVCTTIEKAVTEFGGIDILVANAGIASAAAIEDTTLAVWELNQNVLSRGYFLVSREVYKVMQASGRGNIIFIGSKNALASSSGAAAYSTAKAASLHLARCLALEGAASNIRVNTVNPDAVIEGSAIWSGDWRKQRAEGYGIQVSELEDYYRNRSLLKLSVRPDDIASAVMFFATDESSRSTGNILNVDGGNAITFTR
jgi:rhamnulose-1-phosphate aldolase/alcohol dehydrogenase